MLEDPTAVVSLTEKVCTKCAMPKPLDAFPRSRNECRACHAKYHQAWRQRNPKRWAEITTRSRKEEDPEIGVARFRKWRKVNPEKWADIHRRSHLKNTYGISLEQYNALLEAQGNRCAICGRTAPGKKGWQLDHDHKTLEIRGILCVPCNTALGKLGDTVEGLQRALQYLMNARQNGGALQALQAKGPTQ